MIYKIYDFSGMYKKTLSGSDVISKLSFASQLNGGQGVVNISTSFPYDYTGIVYGDIVKVYDDTKLLYTGFVATIKRKYTATTSTIDYGIVGIASIFSQKIYLSGGVHEFSKNAEPKTLLEDIISQVNANHNLFTYTGTIATYGVNVQLNFDGDTCASAFNKIIQITGWKWYIAPSGIVYVGDNPMFDEYSLTLQDEVESIEINDDGMGIFNDLILKNSISTYYYQNLASISDYGVRQIYQAKTDVVDVTTANNYANTYFTQNADIQSKMNIILNRKNPIVDDIKPGDIVNVRNTSYNLTSLKVQAVRWGIDRVTLEIKSIDNYTQLLKS